MLDALPFSAACERNRQPIARVLRQCLPPMGNVLEIGSCTGQHVVYFAPLFPDLSWQPSDQACYLPGLRRRLQTEGAPNIRDAIELDVFFDWPDGPFDAVYSANTAHIMPWEAVVQMFCGVGERLNSGGVFCLYGPFIMDGRHTAPSNQAFDESLKLQDPLMGLRDKGDLDSLAQGHHMQITGVYSMPANNQMLVYRSTR